MAKRKRFAAESLADLNLSEAIEEALSVLSGSCECDGRGCRLCIAESNLRYAWERAQRATEER